MTYPLVSLLIRSIDRNTLKETLASVAKQNYPNIEVLVVAAVPGHLPLDGVEGLVQVRLVTTDVELHRSAAANKALDLAQGVYALFLDDDDWLAPDHISVLVKSLQEAPGMEVAYSRTQVVESGKTAGDSAVMGLPFDGLRLLAGNWMPLHSVLFSLRLRDLGCRFDEHLDLYEDWDFWLQVAQHTEFLFVPVVSAFYRIHESSGVHGQAMFHGDAAKTIYKKWRHLWTDAQMSALMSHVWQHEDLTQNLKASQAEAMQLKHDIQSLRVGVQALMSQQRDLEVAHARALEDIFNSRSWRLTAPMREALYRVKQWGQTGRSSARVLVTALSSLHKLPALLRKQGVRGLLRRLESELDQAADYLQWIAHNEPSEVDRKKLGEQVQNWRHQPLMSVLVPTYNSPLIYLKEAVESVQAQVYPHWELCIADDASTHPEVVAYLRELAQQDSRVVVTFREKNGHISASSNSALASAQGEWVALLDHDDRLHPLALFHVVQALQSNPDAQIIYSDEDKIDAQGLRFGPYFKGAFNRELMWAQNMISHLGCYRRDALVAIHGFRLGFEGSQDYDLALRVMERCRPDQVVHIPHVLYHWRAIVGSTALAPDQKPYADSASRRALREHLERVGISANVEPAPAIPNMNRVRPKLPDPLPLVSILIPTRDRLTLLKTCIESLQRQTTYPHFELVVVDNGSTESDSLIYLDSLVQQGIKVIRDSRPFNFSALNNLAANHAQGEFLCLMNNDIEIVQGDWLQEMISFAALPGVGAVGAKLWYPNEQDGLQHGGVVIGMGGVAGHAHVGLARGQVGYFGRVALHHRLMAVTAACMVIRKSHYLQVGGLDESIAVAFNDVDFCLRLHEAGLACILTPYAEMIHHESASRGDDLSDAQRERFMAEERFMHERWGDRLHDDPFFSPNLSLAHPDFRPAEKSRTQSSAMH
jgi:glycosyltransferase involved in cell wall biosynthesis